MSKKKTHEEFVEEMKNIHPDIDVVGIYNGAHQKIECHCQVCDNFWCATPSNLLQGRGCKICGNKRQGALKRKTNEQFLQELQEITTTIIPLELYTGALNKIKVKCVDCKHEWYVEPHSLLQGNGCNICSSKRAGLQSRKTHEQFMQEMSIVHPELSVNNMYVSSWTKVNCTCSICKSNFDASPADLLYSIGCPKCNMNNLPQRQPMPKNIFIAKLEKVNKNIKVVDNYTKASARVNVKCIVCGHEWSPVGTSLLCGFGCPVCCQSHGERRIDNYLHNCGIEHKHYKTFDNLLGMGGGKLSYDFYIPHLNCLIEFQGQYHDGTVPMQTEEEFRKQQIHDKLKKSYAIDNGINLVEIWYYDYNHIELILDEYFNSTIQN